jgi:hypothetical protein
METTSRIAYDDKTAGRKVVPLPFDAPFASCTGELESYSIEDNEVVLSRIVKEGNIFETASNLSSHLLIAESPHTDLLQILSMAVSGKPAGIKLLYAGLLAVPTTEALVLELADFKNIRRVMERISRKENAGGSPSESEDWFKKKITVLSISKPLPATDDYDAEKPWLSWSSGVRKALASPDEKWNEAVLDRIKAEIEAMDIRVRDLVASLGPDRKSVTTSFLDSFWDENRWRLCIINESKDRNESSYLIFKRGLENVWDSIEQSLRMSEAGKMLADMFEMQEKKTHTWPQVRTGSALARSLMMHPELKKGSKVPDIASCAYRFIEHAGNGIIEFILQKGLRLDVLKDSSGFTFRDNVLEVDLARIPRRMFAGEDGMPLDIDWTLKSLDRELSYKALVLSFIDNETFLMELLKNPKAISKPGIVSIISSRCRSTRVLSMIATKRELYTGFQNKDVPLNMLLNPSRVSLTALRKFIHVRYIDKMTLQSISGRGGGQIREEVRREIIRYLNSVK